MTQYVKVGTIYYTSDRKNKIDVSKIKSTDTIVNAGGAKLANPNTVTPKTTPAPKTSGISLGNVTNKITPKTASVASQPTAQQLAQQFKGQLNLQSNPEWSKYPLSLRQEAYAIMTQPATTSVTAQQLAQKFAGQLNLQQSPEWNAQPLSVRQEAYKIMTAGNAPAQQQGGVQDYMVEDKVTEKATTTPKITPTANIADQKLKDAMKYIDSANIDQSSKDLLKSIAMNYDYSKEVNVPNILATFNRIKTTTIDPEFYAQAQALEQEVVRSRDFLALERERQVEQERTLAGQDIRQAKAGLEQAGLTFTGQAIQQLGGQSAYSQGGTGALAQQPQNGMFMEGLVNQQNRLISTGNEQAYRKNLESLGRGAEQALGSSYASRLNIPTYQMVGGQVGELERQKQQKLAATLTDIAQNEQLNVADRQSIIGSSTNTT